ncbi:uncharacterized protein KNAG_0D01720 [Huiozyma naganishii CBS 8797]|uniref:Uncharacterized protein n=1 Tax=Huiozyma naganishii (strain ATCC MYA-139 / BCRC 22969 / CBS 8797 / KCTC 17520 / NBRC 10181 / NCYC 3082 / Yp74L-3) TaxID=1071383 RepID=J7RK84_HUIN7|nr:hypothetical protein KNAG_0D01720 [Kazachstania naganishii CBS 8797]CCK69923.1 hypothetical protein KNAG_0D01720 [Kazachstania naganishii CBS 8797]
MLVTTDLKLYFTIFLFCSFIYYSAHRTTMTHYRSCIPFSA